MPVEGILGRLRVDRYFLVTFPLLPSPSPHHLIESIEMGHYTCQMVR